MKIRQTTTCHTCRARKLGCDGKHPSCSQCLFSKRTCTGYNHDLIFVHHHRPASDKPPSRKTAPRQPENAKITISQASIDLIASISPSVPENKCHLEACTNLIISKYAPWLHSPSSTWNVPTPPFRICGSWVGVLPALLSGGSKEGGDLLPAAVVTLGLSIQCKDAENGSFTTAYAQSQGLALNRLRRRLLKEGETFGAELIAASMCLSLAELMLPTSKDGWMAHLKGVGKLLQLSGPENYSTGVSYQLFLGIRHILIFEAFQSRTSTFLEEEAWQTIPFSDHPALPLQSLLNHAALIPSLLETFDILTKSSLTPPLPEIQDLSSRFTSVLSLLDEWEYSYRQIVEDPPYWLTTSSSSLPFPQDEMGESETFTFPNIFTANAFTHLWALRIICLFPLRDLQDLQGPRTYLSSLFLPPLCPALPISSTLQYGQTITHLSLRICKSMAYLLQDAAGLYGPISTLFPLKVAYKTFNLDPSTQKAQITYCQTIVDRLVFKGVDLASLL